MKKIIIFIIFITCWQAVFLTACQQQNISEEISPTLIESSQQFSSNDNYENNSVRELTENVFASYALPDITEADIYRAKLIPGSEEMIKHFFSEPPVENTKGYLELMVESTGERGMYTGRDYSFAAYFTPQGDRYDSLVSLAKSKYGTDYFEQVQSEDIRSAAASQMAASGIGECNYYIYYISEEVFDEITEYYLENLMSGAKEDNIEGNNVYGTYQDFYYIRAIPLIGQYEITDAYLGNYDKGNIIAGTDINIIFAGDRVESVYIDNVYEIIKTETGNEKIISAKEAEEKLKNIYDNELMYDPVTFKYADLVYCPVPDGSEYTMKPAWKFSDGNKVSRYIDALTGDEL